MNSTTGNVAQGVAYSNPYSAAAMAAMQLSQSLFASASPPQMSSSAPFNPFTVDNSGWAVNFGSGNASAQPNPVSTLAQGLANAANGTSTGINLNSPLVLLVIAAVVIVALKHHK
ncbi:MULTISPECIES: hypothetical protein [unclassified Caballeronia]|uniref:hypothetical protein n=1 Tax=unclassified Caballeronia TaxID=2646786 RepID=UPI0020280C56|nr:MULTISPECIES: hypothetical protein [unclassified Caballeronia]